MRKLFVAVAALGMLLTSCAKDDALSGGNGATVSFNIAQPTIASRVLGTENATDEYGTGYTAEDLQYAIFEAEKDDATGVYTIRENGQKPISGVKDGFFSGDDLDNTLDGIRLVRGKHYIALFFAQSDATDKGNWVIDWDAKTMSLRDPEALKAQDETLDAFFTRVDFYVEPTSSNQSFDAELKRPFAQVNVLTDDAEAAQAAGLDVYQTSIEVNGVYTSMNLLDGSIDPNAATTLTYDMAEKGGYKMTVNAKDYDLLSMNYLLVDERKTVDITFRYNENSQVAGNDNTVFETEFDMVPVERNYRTNIIGSLLTSSVSFQIVINPIFTDDIIHDVTKTPEQLLAEAAAAGGKYILASDITLTETLEVTAEDFELDLNGKTLTNAVDNAATDVIVVKEGATLTLTGDGVVEAVTGNNGYAVISEGTVIIKGGTYKSGIDAEGLVNAVVYARGKGQVYVEGGNFPNDNNSAYVLNKKDADRATTVIEVKGGTFINFDPANNGAEGAGTSFMAEGYTTEAAEVDGKTVYTVVEAKPEVLAELDKDAIYIFKAATEMKGGKWYAIVSDNKVATALTGNYGYIQVVEGTERANGLSLPASSAFGFLTTEGGYTIQQYDNKYVYQTGTYDSFNVNATMPEDGAVWSVAVENGAFTITNNSVSKFVQYDPQYNSYGSYDTERGKLPTLYELVEVDNTPMILGVSSSTLSFGQKGETKEFTVETYGSAKLDASADVEWLNVSTSGNTVSVVAEANSGKERYANITVTFGEATANVTVFQEKYTAPGDEPTISDTKGVYESMSFLFDGKTVTNSSTGQVQGTNAYKQDFELNGTTYTALKLGTSSKTGSFETASVGVDNMSTLSFYAVAWKGSTAKLTVMVDGVEKCVLDLTGNDGATGNPVYKALSFSDETDYYEIDVTGISADSKITFSTDSTGYRALICGVNLF